MKIYGKWNSMTKMRRKKMFSPLAWLGLACLRDKSDSFGSNRYTQFEVHIVDRMIRLSVRKLANAKRHNINTTHLRRSTTVEKLFLAHRINERSTFVNGISGQKSIVTKLFISFSHNNNNNIKSIVIDWGDTVNRKPIVILNDH